MITDQRLLFEGYGMENIALSDIQGTESPYSESAGASYAYSVLYVTVRGAGRTSFKLSGRESARAADNVLKKTLMK